MGDITFNFIEVEIPGFDPEFFRLWLKRVADHHKKQIGELSFVFCSDEYLLGINKRYLNHDYYTDIVTFPFNEKLRLSGDVFISWDRVKDNSKEFGNDNEHDELCRVMAHGLLHLIGYDDQMERDKERMRKLENESLKMRK